LKDARLTLKDHGGEGRIFSARLVFSVLVVVVLTGVLLGRMVWLQGIQHDRYRSLSDENRVQTLAVAPPRGLILDRDGRVLADNRPDFVVTVVPERVDNLQATLEKLSRLMRLDEETLERFHERLDNPRRPWEPVPLRSRLEEEEIARITVAQHEMPGVRVEAEAIRHYPHAELTSHLVGYVNRINAQDLRNMTTEEQAGYAGTHFYGRIGVENFYEDQLHGDVGFRKVETNARGRILRVVEDQPPEPGNDLRLGLDLAVQQAAFNALGDRRGAVVAMDPRDGSVLAFVSRPGFDPNLFVTGISHDDYAAYREDLDKPLFNRATQGQYPPGSTVKPFIGLAGLDAGVTDWQYTINDPGFYQLEDDPHIYRDWKKGGHGRVDLEKAVVQSCDTYFYELGFELGIDRMHDYLAEFGLGRKTGIDLPTEYAGILPSRDWKRGARGSSWYHGDTINASIGQGFMLSTPLQLAQATALFARQGEPVIPHVVGRPHRQPKLEPIKLEQPQDWARMADTMEEVVYGLRGTARIVGLNSAYRIAGKTGTSQVFSVAQDEEYNEEEVAERLRDHALFIAYAPADDPAIAVAVIVENGSHGGSTAGPVARATMDAWLLNENGELEVPPVFGGS
jgi:penicillin-binding protein 2